MLYRAMKSKEYSLTQAELHRILDYNPKTGMFTWCVRPSAHVYAGDVAGKILSLPGKPSYTLISIKGRKHRAHRLAFLWMTGEWPPETVDHIDGNGLNNAWGNIRFATYAQNNARLVRKRKRKHDLPRGVFPNGNAFMSKIKVNSKDVYLGRFKTPEEAHEIYLEAVRKYRGEFVNLPSTT